MLCIRVCEVKFLVKEVLYFNLFFICIKIFWVDKGKWVFVKIKGIILRFLCLYFVFKINIFFFIYKCLDIGL